VREEVVAVVTAVSVVGGYPKWYKWAWTSRRVNNVRAT